MTGNRMRDSAHSGRIPDGLPFVVRTSRRKFHGWIGSICFSGIIVTACLFTPVVLLALNSDDYGVRGALIAATPLAGVTTVVAIAYSLLSAWFLGRGPLLAADQHGVWGRPAHPGWHEVIWLPWTAVATITVIRQGEDLVRIDPYPHTGQPIVVGTFLADHNATEIVTALRQYTPTPPVAAAGPPRPHPTPSTTWH